MSTAMIRRHRDERSGKGADVKGEGQYVAHLPGKVGETEADAKAAKSKAAKADAKAAE